MRVQLSDDTKNRRDFSFTGLAVSGGAGELTEAAPEVAADFEHFHVEELVRGWEPIREVEMGEDSGSELSELESSVEGKMEDDEETGRPNFVRAATGAGRRV